MTIGAKVKKSKLARSMESMAKVTGVVYKVYTKEFRDGTNYSIKIDGNPLYYRAGNVNPGRIEGAAVEFMAGPTSEDGKSANIKGEVVVLGNGHASPPKTVSAAGPVDWAKKDASIQYQSSRKDALELVKLLVQTSAIKLPAKTADIAAVISAAVDAYTAGFFMDIESFGAVARANGESKPEKKPKNKPVEEAGDEEEDYAGYEHDED